MLEDRPTDRGREIALDEHSGKVVWEIAPARYAGTGTGITATPAFNPIRHRAFIGTGNPTPTLNPPAGDDPGSESMLCIDTASGRTVWTYGPVHPHDTNDDDFLASPNRFTIGSGAQARWVIGEGNKDGAYYALDAETGKLLWRRAIDPSVPTAMIIGTPAVGNGAIFVSLDAGSSGELTALRTSDGAIMWQRTTGMEYESPVLWGSVVFSTESAGWLDAFSAGDGTPLGRWQLSGRAMGRGTSVADDSIYVAAGKSLTRFILAR